MSNSGSSFIERLQARFDRAGLTSSMQDNERFERYYCLLAKWNSKINLTSLPLKDFPSATLDRLFVEPLVASAFVPEGPLVWIDVGSGGGSPAIPLKVARPVANLTMVESVSKKAAFLREACHIAELRGVRVLASRFEDLPARFPRGSADLLTIRAVRLSDPLLQSAAYLLKGAGRILHFGKAEEPLADFKVGFRRQLLESNDTLSVLEKL